MEARAISTASLRVRALPPATNPAAALSTTTSLLGPPLPERISRIISALRRASPPWISSIGALRKHDIAHGSVKERSVEETNPRLVDTAPHSFGRKIYADTESFYHVGAPAQARHTAIPVFGHSHSCACHHEGCRRGNVEGPGCIPPCAACVYQHLSFGTRKRGADMRAWAHGGNATADDTSKAYQLLNSLPLHPQSREKGGDLRIRGLTAHQCFHDGLGLGPVQMVPFHDPPYGGDYLHGRIICEVTCAHSR